MMSKTGAIVVQRVTCKNSTPMSRAPLSSVKTGYPMQMVAMDILGPFPELKAGNSYILVVVDYFM